MNPWRCFSLPARDMHLSGQHPWSFQTTVCINCLQSVTKSKKTSVAQRSFAYSGPAVWNSLPVTLRGTSKSVFVSCTLRAWPTHCYGSRVVSVLDSGAEGPGFKSQPRRCRVTVLGKLFTPVVPLFTKQRNWQQPS